MSSERNATVKPRAIYASGFRAGVGGFEEFLLRTSGLPEADDETVSADDFLAAWVFWKSIQEQDADDLAMRLYWIDQRQGFTGANHIHDMRRWWNAQPKHRQDTYREKARLIRDLLPTGGRTDE